MSIQTLIPGETALAITTREATATATEAVFLVMDGCGCAMCAAPEVQHAAVAPDATGIVQLDAQGFLLDISNPLSGLVGMVMPNGLPILSSYESAVQIARPGGTWADFTAALTVSYTFDAALIDAGYAAFDAGYQAVARDILDLFSELSGLTFVEATDSATANILFKNIEGQFGGGGWASYPSSGTVHNAIGYPWTAGDIQAGSYVYNTILHEIGHSVGLAHPGNYNGAVDYLTQAVVWNDSQQYSVMSYLGAETTGGAFDGSAATLMLHDILALQIEYGANYSTRAGNTVYGFNSNTGRAAYTFTADDMTSAFAIWDGAGRDTLDFSGFATATVMDLRQGGFSSTGLETYNVAIAYGAVIENGIGGTGNDKIRGNEVANRILGGTGNDIIYGGEDVAPVTARNPRDFTGIAINQDPLTRDQFLSRSEVQALSGAAFTVEMLIEITRIPSSVVALLSYAVPGSDNELLIEGAAEGNLAIIIDGKTRYDTGVLTRGLVDGEPHRLSVTWAADTGAISLYIDGALAHGGTYAAAVGSRLASGGTLIIGQEQDSVGAGFNTRQVLQGIVGDIRVFTTARSAEDIAVAAFARLTGTEAGLAHNWQDAAGGKVIDVAQANPAVNLTDLMPASFVATQSSLYSTGYGAANVLDNNTATSNHTRAGASEWVLVSFDQPMLVEFVQVQNITGWGSRLNGATVSVLDAGGAVIHTWAPISGEGYYGSNLTFTLPDPALISAVRIDHQNQFLHVLEINVFGTATDGVAVPDALLNTDMTIHGGTVADTAPLLVVTPDNDTLIGGSGADTLIGGAGNDSLTGDETGFVARPATDITLVRLNDGTPVSGTTDQWLDQTAGFPMPTAALTLEMMIRLDANAANNATIFGYANGGDTALKRFTLRAWSDTLDFYFFDNTRYDTQIPAGILTGPQAKRLSVTWSSAEGLVKFYVDGALIDTVTVAQGVSLTSGWQFYAMSGHDRVIDGAIGDIRVWDHVRSAGDIARDAWAAYDDAASRSGLVANWQADGATATLANRTTTAGVAALTVQNVTDANPLVFETAAFTAINNDSLLGGEGNDRLDGGVGADTLAGGVGNDYYYVDNADDQVIEAVGQGLDTVSTTVSFTFGSAEIETVIITAATGVSVNGNNTATRYTSGAGADTLAGGRGNDSYYLNGADDVVIETASAGTDLVYTTADYTMGSAIIERVYVTATTGVTVTGNSTTTSYYSGDGADTLIGGAGHDRYYVNGVGDVVVEATGEGTDTVYTSGDFVQNAAAVEYVYVTATTGVSVTGNTTLTRYTSGAGADTLAGGAGNDIYYLNGADDVVIEAAGAGTDSVYTSADFALRSAAIERVYTTSATGVTITGNATNTAYYSAAGADTLTGGGGNDTFVFTMQGAADTITDFAKDYLRFDASGFAGMTALGNGKLGADDFVFGQSATLTQGQFLYDQGALAFDADGTGSMSAYLVVMLENLAALQADWITLY